MAVFNKRSQKYASTDSGSAEPLCGHGSCGQTCSVRYVGPTSHVRDHHILHAASGSTHAWTAAIVSGLAVVLTGAFAFQIAQAAPPKTPTPVKITSQEEILKQIKALNERLDTMNELLNRMNDQCTLSSAAVSGAEEVSSPGVTEWP